MANFTKIDLGTLASLASIKENDMLPAGKVFLKDKLGLSSCEISINCAPKGTKAPYKHKHKQNEEIYIFLSGTGRMQVDGTDFPIEQGTCVRVAPNGCRDLENTGSQDMYYICIQAKENSLEQSVFGDGEICS